MDMQELRDWAVEGLDVEEICNLVGTYLKQLQAEIADPDNDVEDFERIGAEIAQTFKVLTETHKIVREVRDAFNMFVKVAHEAALFSKDQVDVIYTRDPDSGAGRKALTPAEKLANARKAVLKGK